MVSCALIQVDTDRHACHTTALALPTQRLGAAGSLPSSGETSSAVLINSGNNHQSKQNLTFTYWLTHYSIILMLFYGLGHCDVKLMPGTCALIYLLQVGVKMRVKNAALIVSRLVLLSLCAVGGQVLDLSAT